MTIRAITFLPSLRRSTRRPPLNFALFEAAVALYEENRPLDALGKVFEHLMPGLPSPDLKKAPFTFTQGSSNVTVLLDGDEFVVTVPLCKLPSGPTAVAAMRHVLTKISGSGQLHQPRLHGDEIKLEFRDSLSRLHPAKVVEVLRRMPNEADQHDDWLIGQFKAEPLNRAEIAPLRAEDVQIAFSMWEQHWNEVEELLNESRRKRSIFFLNELTAFATNRITCVLPLYGFLVARLEEAVSTFNNAQEDPNKRETTLAKCIKDMKAVEVDELSMNLGYAEYALSPYQEGTPQVLKAQIGPGRYMDMVEELFKSGKSIDSALALVGTYYYLAARFSWEAAVEADFLAGLASVSGKPWRETTTALLEHAKMMSEKYGSDDEKDEDGNNGDDEPGEES
ncbi:MAG: hypothetical protein FWD69_04510 [Polyangiaceae bacterium]|nr:hypothetical protein [Polyangiaceae bacterium]